MFEIYDSDTDEQEIDVSVFYAHRRHYSKHKKEKKTDIDEFDEFSISEQRLYWDNLSTSIENAINKLNPGNIRDISTRLIKLNISRGKGLFCRSIMKAQSNSTYFTHMYAMLVSFINRYLPNIAELLLVRCICSFKDAYKCKEEDKYVAPVLFIAHLMQYKVAEEWMVLEILQILIKTTNLQSIDLVDKIIKVCGTILNSNPDNEMVLKMTFYELKNISEDENIDESVKLLARNIFLTYKNYFEDELEFDLVNTHKKRTHFMILNRNYNPEYELDDFMSDLDFKSTEMFYKNFAKDILKVKCKPYYFSNNYFDEMADDEDESESETEMLSLSHNISIQKTISILVNSNLPPSEIARELMKIKLKPGQEIVLCVEYLEFCFDNSAVYNSTFADILQSFCQLNPLLVRPLEIIFMRIVPVVHIGKPLKLINLAKMFAKLLSTNTISWNVLSAVHLIDSETSYSGRAYFRAMFHELMFLMGRDALIQRFLDPAIRASLAGLFPLNSRYSYLLCTKFFSDIYLIDIIGKFVRSSTRGGNLIIT